MLLLGMLASELHAAQAVRELLGKTQLPVMCTYQGAGVVPREFFHCFGGRVGLFRNQLADDLLDEADVVITIRPQVELRGSIPATLQCTQGTDTTANDWHRLPAIEADYE